METSETLSRIKPLAGHCISHPIAHVGLLTTSPPSSCSLLFSISMNNCLCVVMGGGKIPQLLLFTEMERCSGRIMSSESSLDINPSLGVLLVHDLAQVTLPLRFILRFLSCETGMKKPPNFTAEGAKCDTTDKAPVTWPALVKSAGLSLWEKGRGGRR